MRAIIPTSQLSRRVPEAGRIRIGVRSGKAMKAIDTFRFTSSDQQAIEQVAAIYGGEVKPWTDPKAAPGQYEVITTASEVAVVLPPDPLGGSPIYEQWSGGGCQRRCDGIECEVIQRGPDGPEPVSVACMCQATGEMACEPHTRLSVILPDVRFTGVWRLDTKGWNAAQELPGMVELIQSVQDRGMTRAVLGIQSRRSTYAGQTRQFKVPVLGLADSAEALASGAAQLGALPSAPVVEQPAISAPADDEVVDAEIVEDAPVRACTACGGDLAGCAATKDAEGFHHAEPTDCMA